MTTYDTVASGDPITSHAWHGAGHGICWKAVLAGAAAAASLSLILIVLGIGLGFSAVSPWANDGASASALGVGAILWLTLTQIAASAFGGYLAGRLRSQWTAVHGDEVYFRDTANGFLSWAVATLVTAAVLGSAIGAIAGGAAKAGGAALSDTASAVATAGAAAAGSAGAQAANDGQGDLSYYVDSLFRSNGGMVSPAATPSATMLSDGTPAPTTTMPSSGMPMTPPAAPGSNVDASREVTAIMANAIKSGTLPPDDARYVGQLIAQRSGLTQAEAEKRVNDTFNRVKTTLAEAETAAREAADTARKASAGTALWMFISLLLGAFTASYAGLVGGRQRLREADARYL